MLRLLSSSKAAVTLPNRFLISPFSVACRTRSSSRTESRVGGDSFVVFHGLCMIHCLVPLLLKSQIHHPARFGPSGAHVQSPETGEKGKALGPAFCIAGTRGPRRLGIYIRSLAIYPSESPGPFGIRVNSRYKTPRANPHTFAFPMFSPYIYILYTAVGTTGGMRRTQPGVALTTVRGLWVFPTRFFSDGLRFSSSLSPASLPAINNPKKSSSTVIQ